MDKIEVTQKVRVAAFDAYMTCFETVPNDLWLKALLDGKHDSDEMTQAFARFERDILATRTDATPVAWLIERDDISTVQSGGRICMHYYAEEKYKRGRHYWTPDHTMAKRFATRDAAINETNGDPILRVAEHMWIDPHPPATDVAALVEAAYREGWHDGMMAQGYGGTIESTDDDDWATSKSRQALAPFTKGQNDDA